MIEPRRRIYMSPTILYRCSEATKPHVGISRSNSRSRDRGVVPAKSIRRFSETRRLPHLAAAPCPTAEESENHPRYPRRASSPPLAPPFATAFFPVRLIGLLQAIAWLPSATSATTSLVDCGVSTDIDLRTSGDGWSAESAAQPISNNLHNKLI
jgi:hypothetical protein